MSERGALCGESGSFSNCTTEGFPRFFFTVGEENGRTRPRCDVEPFQQIAASGMCAKSAEGVDFCFYADGFAQNADFFFTVDEATSERAVALEADDDDVGGRFPKMVFEVVQDASCVAHAGSGHHEAGSVDFVNGSGLLRGCSGFQGAEVFLEVTFGQERAQFFVEQFRVA